MPFWNECRPRRKPDAGASSAQVKAERTTELDETAELARLMEAHTLTYQPRNPAETKLVQQLSDATLQLREFEQLEDVLWEAGRPDLDRLEKLERDRAKAQGRFFSAYTALEAIRKERDDTNPEVAP